MAAAKVLTMWEKSMHGMLSQLGKHSKLPAPPGNGRKAAEAKSAIARHSPKSTKKGRAEDCRPRKDVRLDSFQS